MDWNRYIDEFGEVKAVAYESGKAQGFAPRGQHLPALPRPSKSGGNIGEDDEFGTDEDWNSVDADQDGIPDKPRPKEERPVVTTKPPRTTPRPTRPAAVFTAAEDAPQPVRPLPRPTLIPVEDMPQSLRPFQPFQQQRPQFQPQQFQLQPQQFRFQPQPQDVQQFRDDRQQQRFSEPIFPSQFRSIPAGFPQQRSFDSVPFSFQPQQPRE